MNIYQCITCNTVCNPFLLCANIDETKTTTSAFSKKYPEVYNDHHHEIDVYANNVKVMTMILIETLCEKCVPHHNPPNVCFICKKWYCCEPEYGAWGRALCTCRGCKKTLCRQHAYELKDYEFYCEKCSPVKSE